MVDKPRTDPIQRTLARSGIGPDLIEAMQEGRGETAPPAPSGPEASVQPPPTGAEAVPQTDIRQVAPAPPAPLFPVVIELNTGFPDGAARARAMLLKAYLKECAKSPTPDAGLARRVVARLRPRALPPDAPPLFAAEDRLAIANSLYTDHYLFGELTEATIDRLDQLSVARFGAAKTDLAAAPVYKVWYDQKVRRSIFKSAQTIKCDVARTAFTATGRDIVWAVADTGIDGDHPHFKTHKTLKLDSGLRHRDFLGVYQTPKQASDAALVDEDGHGTHVAGIIAGETRPTAQRKIKIRQEVRTSDAFDDVAKIDIDHDDPILGLAPQCKIMSLKVLHTGDSGRVSYLLAAIGYIQQVNESGRNIKVHGLNLSLGYPFLPRWFAAGQSPLCVEVDRLARSGVVVVVAAGNGGYGQITTADGKSESAVHEGTIDDPGNAQCAITVGSAHRDMPHTYGVSFFSGKGPTADGRPKPDLVAPGERIVSCARMALAPDKDAIPFIEESGTSMAAPHVSGAIAAFLSVRTEFKGQTQVIKDLFCANATDLKRKAEYQGSGLVDVLRTMQAV
jgi:serine protease AprX